MAEPRAATVPRWRGPGGRPLRVAHLTTVDMSLSLLLGTELAVDVEIISFLTLKKRIVLKD